MSEEGDNSRKESNSNSGDGFGGISLVDCQAGDQRAMAALYKEFNPKLSRYLYTKVGYDYPDVTSEAWLKIAGQLRYFKGTEKELASWMFTIARNCSIDWLRKHKNKAGGSDVLEASEQGQTGAAHNIGYEALLGVEAVNLIKSVVNQNQADVILLRIIGGFSTSEVAAMLDKKPGWVKINQERGLKKLAHNRQVQEYFEQSKTRGETSEDHQNESDDANSGGAINDGNADKDGKNDAEYGGSNGYTGTRDANQPNTRAMRDQTSNNASIELGDVSKKDAIILHQLINDVETFGNTATAQEQLIGAQTLSKLSKLVVEGQPLEPLTRKKSVIGQILTAKIITVTVAGLLGVGGVAAAATGNLPEPIQKVVSETGSHVGLDLPNPGSTTTTVPEPADKKALLEACGKWLKGSRDVNGDPNAYQAIKDQAALAGVDVDTWCKTLIEEHGKPEAPGTTEAPKTDEPGEHSTTTVGGHGNPGEPTTTVVGETPAPPTSVIGENPAPPPTTEVHQTPPTTERHEAPPTTGPPAAPPTTEHHEGPPTTERHEGPPTTTKPPETPVAQNITLSCGRDGNKVNCNWDGVASIPGASRMMLLRTGGEPNGRVVFNSNNLGQTSSQDSSSIHSGVDYTYMLVVTNAGGATIGHSNQVVVHMG